MDIQIQESINCPTDGIRGLKELCRAGTTGNVFVSTWATEL